MKPNAVIYDCEIIRCIPTNGPLEPTLQYCEGWHDHAGMGISVIGAYDFLTDSYRVFLEDNFSEFTDLVRQRDVIIGFNSLAFDDKLCAAHGLEVKTTYDLLCEVRVASGQPPYYGPGTRPGYSLEKIARANLGTGKTGNGALAPELWQRGKYGAVISYCLDDVKLTRDLFELGVSGRLKDPTNGELLELARPEGGDRELGA